jgi:hypothetical protein
VVEYDGFSFRSRAQTTHYDSFSFRSRAQTTHSNDTTFVRYCIGAWTVGTTHTFDRSYTVKPKP